MRYRHSETAENSATIDMTPLIDVVFILLIFFILTASFQQQNSLSIERPQSAVNDADDRVSLVVTVDKSGTIWLDNKNTKLALLTARVRERVAGSGTSSAVIQIDKQVQSGRLIEIVDKIRIAGVDNVAVATEQAG